MQLLNLSVFLIDKDTNFHQSLRGGEPSRPLLKWSAVECAGHVTRREQWESLVCGNILDFVTYDDSGNQTIDRTATVCKHCATC